jgi:hypothetical protein
LRPAAAIVSAVGALQGDNALVPALSSAFVVVVATVLVSLAFT